MRIPPEDYAYSIGRIRAMETFLIKEEVFKEATEADLSEALKLFTESPLYSSGLMRIKDSAGLEKILKEELSGLKQLIRSLMLDEELSVILDGETIDDIYKIKNAFKNEFLRDYIMYLADMHNIKTFLRLYILKEPQGSLESLLTCEGFIKKKDFLELYSKDLAAFLNRLEYVHKDGGTIDYTYYIREAVRKAAEGNSFIGLERAINDFLVRYLKQAKYIIFGPEPVAAYYFARLGEINLIRMIILAKINGVADDIVKERLNSVYA